MNYKDITLEEAKEIYKKTGCILICDADNMSINIEGELVNEIKELIDKLVNAVKPIIDRVVEVVKILGGYINNIFNKKKRKDLLSCYKAEVFRENKLIQQYTITKKNTHYLGI